MRGPGTEHEDTRGRFERFFAISCHGALAHAFSSRGQTICALVVYKGGGGGCAGVQHGIWGLHQEAQAWTGTLTLGAAAD